MADATVTFNLFDAVGGAFDYRRAKVWIVFNTDDGWIVDENGDIRADAGTATVASNGAVTIAGIPVPGVTTNPTDFQVKIYFDVSRVLPGVRGVERMQDDFGWMTITEDATLDDLIAEQYVPPTWISEAITTLAGYVTEGEALLAAQAEIAGIDDTDSAVAALIDDELVGPDSTAAVVAKIEDINSAIGAALYAGYVGKIRGLTPNVNTAPVRAENQAILEDAIGSANSHGIVPGSNVIYYTDEVQLLGNVDLEGQGGFDTQLRNPGGSVFAVEGSHINIAKLYLRSGGGDHTIRQTGAVDQSHLDLVKLWQEDDDYSIWDNGGFGFVDNRFTRFLSWHTESATVPTWKFVDAGGEINNNVWDKFRAQFSGNYHFWVESTDANTQLANVWRDANWQVCSGGFIKLIGCREYLIENSISWDLEFSGGELLRHGILAETNASNALCVGTIRGHRRTDGDCDTGVYDIKLPASNKGDGTILEKCQNLSSVDPLLIDLNSNVVTVTNPSGAASTLATLSNTSGATLINKDGITVPSTLALKVGTLPAQVGPAKVSQVVDPASLSAASEVEFTITVTGAVTTDHASVSSSLIETNLAKTYEGVTAADTVTVRIRNMNVSGGSAIDPSARTWRAVVTR